MATKFLTIPSKTLATSINASSTTLQLSDVLGWDSVALTSGAIGDKLYATLRNPQGTLLEVMQLDPTSLSGTTFNITLRGLKFDGDLSTEVTANKLSWTKGSTIIEIGTDTPQLLNNLVRIVDAQTIAGIKTFTSIPVLPASNPTSDNEAARKAYVDSAAAGSAAYQKIVSSATAGETVSAGQLVYQKAADNRWWLCDADTASTIENVNIGIAQGAGTAGSAIANGVLTYGLDSNQTGLTANAKYYASNTAGALSATPGTKEVSLGFALSTTTFYLTPRFDQTITEDIQDGLDSTTALSATNKVISQKDLQIGAEIYAADAEASDTYVITLSPVPAAYATGMTIRFKANTANTGACTINVNSLGAKSIKKNVSSDLTTGDIIASQIHTIIYDGTNFQMQSALGEVTTATAGKIAVRNSTGDVTVPTTPTAGTDASSKTYTDTKSNKIATVVSAVTVGDTAVETNLVSVSIPANTLSTNNAIRLRLFISNKNNTADNDTFTLKLKYGATTVVTNAQASSNTATKKGYIEAVLYANGATNSQIAYLTNYFSDDGVGTGIAQEYLVGTGTSAEDSTGALNIIISAQWSTGRVSNTITMHSATIEKLIS